MSSSAPVSSFMHLASDALIAVRFLTSFWIIDGFLTSTTLPGNGPGTPSLPLISRLFGFSAALGSEAETRNPPNAGAAAAAVRKLRRFTPPQGYCFVMIGSGPKGKRQRRGRI